MQAYRAVFPTVNGQGMKGTRVWQLQRMSRKRMVVSIQRVTATNITQPYAGACTKTVLAISAQWINPRSYNTRQITDQTGRKSLDI